MPASAISGTVTSISPGSIKEVTLPPSPRTSTLTLIGSLDLLHGEKLENLTLADEPYLISPSSFISTMGGHSGFDVFQHTWKMGQKLMDGWVEIGNEFGLQLRTSGLAPIHAPQMDMGTPELTRDAWTFFLQESAKRGVLFRRGGLNFISYSHKEEDIEFTLNVCHSVMKLMKEALQKGDLSHRLETFEIKPSFRQF